MSGRTLHDPRDLLNRVEAPTSGASGYGGPEPTSDQLRGGAPFPLGERKDDVFYRKMDYPEHRSQEDLDFALGNPRTGAPPEVSRAITAAREAVARHPVAAFGWDEKKIAFGGGSYLFSGGTYSNRPDAPMWASTSGHEVPVHESVHRGLALLSKLPDAPATLKELTAGTERARHLNEMYVRYIMMDRMGDPENRTGGVPQREQALHFFEGDRADARKNMDMLREIEAFADEKLRRARGAIKRY